MRLTALKGTFYRYAGERSFKPVTAMAEADSVMFLCPACFEQNGGPVGTHRIRIDFVGRGTPDEHCIHGSDNQPVRWNAAGSSLDDLSLTPSIQILGGCNWHGFVTNGDAA